jgi:hypothetical protein
MEIVLFFHNWKCRTSSYFVAVPLAYSIHTPTYQPTAVIVWTIDARVIAQVT